MQSCGLSPTHAHSLDHHHHHQPCIQINTCEDILQQKNAQCIKAMSQQTNTSPGLCSNHAASTYLSAGLFQHWAGNLSSRRCSRGCWPERPRKGVEGSTCWKNLKRVAANRGGQACRSRLEAPESTAATAGLLEPHHPAGPVDQGARRSVTEAHLAAFGQANSALVYSLATDSRLLPCVAIAHWPGP